MAESKRAGRATRPRIVVIGASAGGIEPLMRIASGLPDDLDAAVFVVVHVPPSSQSVLPRVLKRAGRLDASHAAQSEPIRRGRIYVAPPDRHMLIEDGMVLTRRGPLENRSRPAIDPLFRTAARAHGDMVIGVILSGSLDDGAAGMAEVRRSGGVGIVQDPAEAIYPSMPTSALRESAVDYCLPADEIAPTIERLVRERSEQMTSDQRRDAQSSAATEESMDAQRGAVMPDSERAGIPAAFGCPDCGGSLWQLDDGEILTFRCRVGHAYTPRILLDAQGANVETGLWQAVRALEEQASLAARLAARSLEDGQTQSADRFSQQATRATADAQTVRGLLSAEPAVTDLDGAIGA
ncbi:MAG TPA: chemotaxis protein CheB [Candidatus Limnocylindria bacterium]